MIATTNSLLPQVKLTAADVDMHYSGVRPLPYVGEATPATVTRRHSLTENLAAPVPFYSVIGGKLTTSRSLAEETTALCVRAAGPSVTRPLSSALLPGAAGFPSRRDEQTSVPGKSRPARLKFSQAQVSKPGNCTARAAKRC